MSNHSEHPSQIKRRTLLKVSPALVGAAKYGVLGGTGAVAVPFLYALSPKNGGVDNEAATPIKINLKDLEENPNATAQWGRYPLLIQKRSPETLKLLQSAEHLSRLRDPNSERKQQPGYACNWHRSLVPEIGVYVNICTHLGCLSRPTLLHGENAILCPCHGSQFDSAARVLKNMPAQFNLPVPPHKIEKTSKGTFLVIGEDENKVPFDLNTVEKI